MTLKHKHPTRDTMDGATSSTYQEILDLTGCKLRHSMRRLPERSNAASLATLVLRSLLYLGFVKAVKALVRVHKEQKDISTEF